MDCEARGDFLLSSYTFLVSKFTVVTLLLPSQVLLQSLWLCWLWPAPTIRCGACILRQGSSQVGGPPSGPHVLLPTPTTRQSRCCLPHPFFSVPLALMSQSDWLRFCFPSCPTAPSAASSIETLNICWLPRMKSFHTGDTVWLSD